MLAKLKQSSRWLLTIAVLALSIVCISTGNKVSADDGWVFRDAVGEKIYLEQVGLYVDNDGLPHLMVDSDNHVRFTLRFTLDSLPEGDDWKKEYGIFFAQDPESLIEFSINPNYAIKGSALKETNEFDLDVEVEKDQEILIVALEDFKSGTHVPVQLPSVGTGAYLDWSRANRGNDGDSKKDNNVKETDNWELSEHMSNISVKNTKITMGSGEKLAVNFDVSAVVKSKDSTIPVYFIIKDSGGKVVDYKSFNATGFVYGKNTVEIPVHFPSKGIYKLVITDYYNPENEVDSDYWKELVGEYWSGDDEFKEEILSPFEEIEIVVKNPTGKDGETVNVTDSVTTQFLTYSKGAANNLKVYYSVSDVSCDYRLFVTKGWANKYSEDTSSKKMCKGSDLLSKLDELPLKEGKTCEVKLNTTFPNYGLYTVCLVNETTKKLVAKQCFYVVPEKYLVQRDLKNEKDGEIPFSCTADIQNIDLGKGGTTKFMVGFPINFKKYLQEFQNVFCYGMDPNATYTGSDYFGKGVNPYGDYQADSSSIADMEQELDDLKDFLRDDYVAYMTVKYVPEGSKESRILYREKLKGMYKEHEINISSKELIEKIYETRGSDIGYAGVVTVEFSNEKGALGFETIANEAIQRFTESFSFAVYKQEGIKSAKTDKTTERAYAEKAKFTVTDNLGGLIYADIYSGKKKVASVEGKCSLNKNGTATGILNWNLKNSSGKYVANGKYTAKIYTVNEYYEFDKNGKKSSKKVTSKVKSVSFKLVKPNRKLTLSAKAIGDTGDNFTYVENPVINISTDVNIGSKVKVTIKNSSGKTVKTDSAEVPRNGGNFSIALGKVSVGTYKAEINAETLDNDKKSTTVSFQVKNMPKPSISNASVSMNDSGLGTVSFKVSVACEVTVQVKSGSTVKQKVLSQKYSAGTIKASFSAGGYAAGNYSVVITAKNSGGTATVTKTFTIKKKPAVATKPTASSLNVRIVTGKSGDQYQGSFFYTGKNATIVVDIMYDDYEEIVYSYQATTKSESGTYTYTWDGFKANGFRAWEGNYTMRVYVVNNAGSSGYLRKSFVIAAG